MNHNYKALELLVESSNWESAVVVISEDSFPKKRTELKRSFKINHNNKYFQKGLSSTSLLGQCLDGTKSKVRLDWYFEAGDWTIEKIYILK